MEGKYGGKIWREINGGKIMEGNKWRENIQSYNISYRFIIGHWTLDMEGKYGGK
jgi:hypothetical protein